MSDKQPIIIIKKIKKGGHGGHHGGAWKIAYADFVTAMMAFFLLMWLLNATSEEQKRGIANYFDPLSSEAKGGGNLGVMGGSSIKETDGSLDDSSNRIKLRPAPLAEKGPGGQGTGTSKAEDQDSTANGGVTDEDRSKAEAKQEIQEQLMKQNTTTTFKSKQEEEKALKEASEAIKKKIESTPDLVKLSENIKMELTDEGLRISIIDQTKTAMFPNGSSRMYKQMQDLLASIGTAIKDLPNKIAIAGHTDGKQYTTNSLFGNWELSSERANASRRIISQNGVVEDRFQSVVGKADRELFDPKDPLNPQNRRITVTLLREIKG